MEQNTISLQEVRVYRVLRAQPETWFTNIELHEHVKASDRTVRAMTLKFMRLGLVDLMELFPGYRYRWSEKAAKRNRTYLDRLEAAAEILPE